MGQADRRAVRKCGLRADAHRPGQRWARPDAHTVVRLRRVARRARRVARRSKLIGARPAGAASPISAPGNPAGRGAQQLAGAWMRRSRRRSHDHVILRRLGRELIMRLRAAGSGCACACASSRREEPLHRALRRSAPKAPIPGTSPASPHPAQCLHSHPPPCSGRRGGDQHLGTAAASCPGSAVMRDRHLDIRAG